jgi:hypothetical protein
MRNSFVERPTNFVNNMDLMNMVKLRNLQLVEAICNDYSSSVVVNSPLFSLNVSAFCSNGKNGKNKVKNVMCNINDELLKGNFQSRRIMKQYK